MGKENLKVDLTSIVKSSLSVYSKNLLFTGVVDREGHLTLPRKITSDMEAYAYGKTSVDINSLSTLAEDIVNNVIKIINEMPGGQCGCNHVFDEPRKVNH